MEPQKLEALFLLFSSSLSHLRFVSFATQCLFIVRCCNVFVFQRATFVWEVCRSRQQKFKNKRLGVSRSTLQWGRFMSEALESAQQFVGKQCWTCRLLVYYFSKGSDLKSYMTTKPESTHLEVLEHVCSGGSSRSPCGKIHLLSSQLHSHPAVKGILHKLLKCGKKKKKCELE